MHPRRFETSLLRQPAENQECACARERPALRIQKELGPVAPIEKRPAAREVATKCIDCLAPDGHDPFLVALARSVDEAPFEIDPAPLEPDRLAHTQARAVQELDQSSVGFCWHWPVTPPASRISWSSKIKNS